MGRAVGGADYGGDDGGCGVGALFCRVCAASFCGANAEKFEQGFSRSHYFGGNAYRVAPAARVVVMSGIILLFVPLERHGMHSHQDDGNEKKRSVRHAVKSPPPA